MKAASALLMAGIICATLTEAIAGTVLSIARFHIGGDAAATPDELAWLDIAYTALKLVGFMSAPWLLTRIPPRNLIAGATLAMGAACLGAAMTVRLDLLLALRAVQGISGGALLVAGQTFIFLAFARHQQPVLQALFAMGSVIAPATITPALGGWLLDQLSWSWIFLSVVPLSLAAAGLVLAVDGPAPAAAGRSISDWRGLALLVTSLCCFTWVLSQGSRWNWFDEPGIVWPAIIGLAALLAFLAQQVLAAPNGLADMSAFRSDDFAFASVVSLVAGAALFGSAFLTPAFAVSRLAFTPTDVGWLLLPGAAFFMAALFLSAYLMQARGLPPIATVPLGILLITVAMWMLSGSTSESSASDMMTALLLRGAGLAFLLLSITLVAFSKLPDRSLAFGIGLFNTGRQIGGLMGVAALQTLIEHEAVANAAVLSSNVTGGLPAVGERLAATAAMLAAKGLHPEAAIAMSTSLLGRAVAAQSVVIAFDTAFSAIALLFVVAAPLLIGFKVALGRLRRS